MRRFVPEICGVEYGSREKSGQKFDVFAPQLNWERAPDFFFFFGGGVICKSTAPPTYSPSLVEIPWRVFHLC